MRSDIIDIEVVLHNHTDKAFFVSTSGKHNDAVWIPKSLCEIDHNGTYLRRLHKVTLTLPERIAIEKGLV